MSISTREEWLTLAANEILKHLFDKEDSESVIANWRFSSGFPVGSRGSSVILGQCLSPTQSSSGCTEIYISPTISDSAKVLEVLHHEIVHAHVGVEHKHDKYFKRWMKWSQLTGSPKATRPTFVATERYKKIIAEYGEYPHSSVKLPERGSVGSPMKKACCPKCGYTVRVTEKWLAIGLPYCPNPAHEPEVVQFERRN